MIIKRVKTLTMNDNRLQEQHQRVEKEERVCREQIGSGHPGVHKQSRLKQGGSQCPGIAVQKIYNKIV